MRHKVAIFASVVLLHLVVLWAVNTGLLVRITELAAPVKVLLSILPTSPSPGTQAEPKADIKKVEAKVPESPLKKLVELEPTAPTPATTNQTVELVSPVGERQPASGNQTPSPKAQPGNSSSAQVDSVASEADHLFAPKPSYPRVSSRLGEEGTAVLRVLVGKDGLPKSVELHKSSGFTRLDDAAQAAVKEWRFTPKQENGIAVEKWYLQPIPFHLVP